jgi:hypothetical protein
MKITQAAATVVKVAEDEWIALIALNDEEGGPEGVRVNIVNDDQFNQPTLSHAAKVALEVIDGLKLESFVDESIPVMHDPGSEPEEEEVTQEFRDALQRLNFTSGRFWIDERPDGEVKLSGCFIDEASENVFIWTLGPRNDLLPGTVTDAAKLGAGMLKGLGLNDADHGHHVVKGPDAMVMVDDVGREITKQ